MNVLILGATVVPAEVETLKPAEKVGIRRDDVLEYSMFSAYLPHQDATALLHNVGFNDARIGFESRNWLVPSENGISQVCVAPGADGISYPRKAKGWP
jgi:hypothetical protein